MSKRVTIKEFTTLFNGLVESSKKTNDPIPEMSPSNLDKIDGCLKTPFMTFDGKDLYKTIFNKASILLYVLIKNHPLGNGNKRMAYITTYFFLNKNGVNLNLSDSIVYGLVVKVANSDPNKKDYIVAYINSTLKNNSK